MILDRQRLGKQRVEAFQILNVLNDPNAKGWRNHPAVRMWRDYSDALALYTYFMCSEWINQGYRDTLRDRIEPYVYANPELPDWLWQEDVILSHRSNLVRKLPSHYRNFWPDIPDDLPYVWPK